MGGFSCSSDSRFGMGPRCLVPGDEIGLQNGARTPFILPRRDAGEGYRTVGEAYVHGIM